MKKAIVYTVVFLFIQVVASSLVQLGWMAWKGADARLDATGMVVTMTIFSVATLCVFLRTRWTELSRAWLLTHPWFVLFWCVLAALGTIIPSSCLQEMLPELPNIVENEFDMILRNRLGYFVIGLLAPFVEEVVFRGAVLRALLRCWPGHVWRSILVSAVLFSAAHLNPAQLPHTLLAGVLLGWFYSRTGSIIPGVVFHWVNNTVAYVVYNIYPDPKLKLVDLFGSEVHVAMAVAFSLCILLPALFQLNLWMRQAEPMDISKKATVTRK